MRNATTPSLPGEPALEWIEADHALDLRLVDRALNVTGFLRGAEIEDRAEWGGDRKALVLPHVVRWERSGAVEAQPVAVCAIPPGHGEVDQRVGRIE